MKIRNQKSKIKKSEFFQCVVHGQRVVGDRIIYRMCYLTGT